MLKRSNRGRSQIFKIEWKRSSAQQSSEGGFERGIVRVALATGWTLADVKALTLAEFGLVAEELSGKRHMDAGEIMQELSKWQEITHPKIPARHFEAIESNEAAGRRSPARSAAEFVGV